MIAQQKGPCCWPAISYGGAVITEAGNQPMSWALSMSRPSRPTPAKSLLDVGAAFPPPPGVANAAPDSDGYVWINPAKFRESFCQDLTADEGAGDGGGAKGPRWAAPSPTRVTAPAWKNKPSWYQVSSEDRMIAPANEKRMAERMGAKKIVTLAASHASLASMPAEICALIDEAGEGDRLNRFRYRNFRIGASSSSGLVCGAQRPTTSPLRSTRNLVKFHLIASVPSSPAFSLLRNWNSGCAAGPLTSTLGEHRKRHAVILLAEGADLFCAARFLRAELVAGKAQHRQPLRFQFFIQGLKPGILRRDVNPHALAVLTINSTRRDSRPSDWVLPSRRSAEISYRLMAVLMRRKTRH